MTAVDVLVFDGCEALDALGPLEVLAYGGLDVRLVALGGPRSVRTSQGVVVSAHANRPSAEWLVVPGGAWAARRTDPGGEAASGAIGGYAREHVARGGMSAAVCTGALWLAGAGLVGGRPATTHHQYWDELASYGAAVQRGARVVDDGDLVTSGGICSGLFLGLHLVERLVGASARADVENEIELPSIPGFPVDATSVVLFVVDPAASSAWWATALQLPVHSDGAFYWVTTPAGFELGFHPADAELNAPGASSVTYLRVHSVDVVLARLVEYGATLHRGPLRIGAGRRIAQVRDPFGAVVGLDGP